MVGLLANGSIVADIGTMERGEVLTRSAPNEQGPEDTPPAASL
jgi:hypothetical protein